MRSLRGVDAYKGGERALSFSSAKDAESWLRENGWPKADRSRVYGAASGRRHSAYGFEWRFTGEPARKADKRLYKIWWNMKIKCADPSNPSYHLIGGIGIRVCDEWQDYSNFAEWAISSGYTSESCIERIDLSKDYGPDNCEWTLPHDGRDYIIKPHWKPVVRIDPESGEEVVYESVTDAAECLIEGGEGHYLGDVRKTCGNICCVLAHKTMTAYGYAWDYAEIDTVGRSYGSGERDSAQGMV